MNRRSSIGRRESQNRGRAHRRAVGAGGAIAAFLAFGMSPGLGTPASADFDDIFDPGTWNALFDPDTFAQTWDGLFGVTESGSAAQGDLGTQLADSFQTDFWLPF
ncbi:hypothetical protein KIH27_21790, partial [Mycobacterium sp. M1]